MRLNFSQVRAMVVDHDPYSQMITQQILRGFGVRDQHCAESVAEAQAMLGRTQTDLCLIEADLPDMTGFELVRWIRRQPQEELRFMPVLIVTGYTQTRNVAASRDCGANSVVAKPFAPQTLFQHIAWAAASRRGYLESATYCGPDRRFRSYEEGEDGPRRRITDMDMWGGEANAAGDAARKGGT